MGVYNNNAVKEITIEMEDGKIFYVPVDMVQSFSISNVIGGITEFTMVLLVEGFSQSQRYEEPESLLPAPVRRLKGK